MNVPLVNVETLVKEVKAVVKTVDVAKNTEKITAEVGRSIDSTEASKIKPDKFVDSKDANVTVTPSNIKQAWEKAAKLTNEIIPDKQELTIGTNKVNLGSQTDIKFGNETVKIDTISSAEQIENLKKTVKDNINSDSIKKLTNPTDAQEKEKLKEQIEKLKAPQTGVTVTLLDNSQSEISNLDNNRALLNKRSEEIKLALKNTNLNEEQKQELKKEQEGLKESIKSIDTVPKIFATQNGANLKIDKASNIRSVTKEQINSNDSLTGYEGFFSDKNTENQTQVKTPTVKEAYQAFQAQMKKETGKDFTLGDQQNLVMYREGDEVKFLIVDSKTDDKKNKTTVISKPIIAKREDDGSTNITVPVKREGNGKDITMEANKFVYGAGDTANVNSDGTPLTINLVKDGKAQLSFLGESTTGVASKGKNQSGITIPLENISISEGKITGAGRYIQNTYKITPTDEQLKLLRTTSKYNVFSEKNKDTNDGTYTISQNDLKTISSELNSSIYQPVVNSLNQGGNLSDITLDQIDLNKINTSKYSEDVNNYRYRVLMTYWMLHPERRDNRFTEILKNYDKDKRDLIGTTIFTESEMPDYWINPLNQELKKP